MFDFLQGFAYGLLLSCMPWFMLGMLFPRVAVPTEPPSRWQLFLRYGFIAPAVGVLTWLTSLWGGLDAPSLIGWLAGLAAIPTEVFLERNWRRWKAARAARRLAAQREAEALRMQAVLERQQREAGMWVLDVDAPPVDADETVKALVEVKRQLVALQRPDVAILADRLYSRYSHAMETIAGKFDPRELTYGRSRGLVRDVANGAVGALASAASLVSGVVHIDADFVRRKLQALAQDAPADERAALEKRLVLVDESERRIVDARARVEEALTALDDTAVAVSRVNLALPQADFAAEQALAELRRFAEKAELYGRRA